MAYPGTSDFTSSAQYASWFFDRRSGERSCQVDAWNVLADVQGEVRARIEASGGQLPTYDRGLVLTQDVLVEPSYGWDRTLLRGLWAVAARYNAPAGYLDAVRASAEGGPITPGTMQTALWVAYLYGGWRGSEETYGEGSPDWAVLPAGVVLPNHGFAPTRPTDAAARGILCQAIPAGTITPPTLPPGGGRAPFSPVAAIAVLALAAAGIAVLARGTPIDTGKKKR